MSQFLSEVQAAGFKNKSQSAISISQYMCEVLEATAQVYILYMYTLWQRAENDLPVMFNTAQSC